MPCISNPDRTPETIARQQSTIERLRASLADGTVQAAIGPTGAIAFRGRSAEDLREVSDLCAYRALATANSPELRRAIMRAEALSGRKLSAHAIHAGTHSHDGGKTWGTHG